MTLSSDNGGQTALEDAVRDMLHSRAEQVSISSNAWIRTTARARRSHPPVRLRGLHAPGRRTQSWLVPLTAAVAVAAIGIASATGTGGGRVRATTGADAGGQPGTAPGRVLPPAHVCDSRVQGRQIIPTDPYTSATATLGAGSGQQVTWFRQANGHSQTAWLQTVTGGTLLCVDTLPDGNQPGTSWMVVPQLTSADAAALYTVSVPPVVTDVQVPEGIALRTVTSVDVVNTAGQQVRGTVVPIPGTQYVTWWLGYASPGTDTVLFRNAAGQVVSRLTVRLPTYGNFQNTPGGPAAPIGFWQQAGQGKVWTTVRFSWSSPRSGGPTLSVSQRYSDGFQDFNLGAGIPAGQVAVFVDSIGSPNSVMPLYGSAEQAVTTVTAILPDGRTYKGTVLDAPGFPYKAWTVTYPTRDRAKLIFSGAKGQVLGHLSLPPNPHAGGLPQTGS
jgi:hypothetical protein